MEKPIQESPLPSQRQRIGSGILLCSILLLGTLLRLWNVDHGLPYHLGPDESFFLKPALRMLIDHDLNPHWFGHPATPFIYILSAVYGFLGILQVALGHVPNLAEYLSIAKRNPVELYLVGRIVNIGFSILSVYLTYLLGKRLFNVRVALMSAAIVAFSPVFIEWTQIMRSDIILCLLYLCVTLGCVGIAETGSWKSYIAAGSFLGLATATKYPASLLALSIVAAHLARWWPHWGDIISKGARLMTAGLVSVATLFIGSPYLFLDYPKALSDLSRVATARWWFHFADGPLETLAWYFSGPFPRDLSLIGLVATVWGVVGCLQKRDRRLWPVFTTAGVYLFLIGWLDFYWSRFIVPVLPAMAVFCAYGTTRICATIPRFRLSYLHCTICIAVVGMVIGSIFFTSLKEGLARGIEPMEVASNWVLEHIPPGSRILIEKKTVLLPDNTYTIYVVDKNHSLKIAGSLNPHMIFSSIPIKNWNKHNRGYILGAGEIRRLKNLQEIDEKRIDYIIIGPKYDWKRRGMTHRSKFRHSRSLHKLNTLMMRHKLLYEINAEIPRLTVHFPMLKGDRIRIYRVRKNPRDN